MLNTPDRRESAKSSPSTCSSGSTSAHEARGDLTDVAPVEELDVLTEQRVEHHPPQPDADALGALTEAVVADAGRHRLDDQQERPARARAG